MEDEFNEAGVSTIVAQSLEGNSASFVLSACTPQHLGRLIQIRDTLWSDRAQGFPQRQLAPITLRFPWGEYPAHMLFASVIEQWKPEALEKMLSEALRNQLLIHGHDANPVLENVSLVEVLRGLSNPSSLGSKEFRAQYSSGEYYWAISPQLRAYLLDPTPQTVERRRLGLSRSLTIQDRYELLVGIWRCQQGLALPERTHLWVMIDEAEQVLDYLPTERKLLANGLCTLISRLRSDFTLWINISDPTIECVEEVKKAIGKQLLQWLDYDLTNERVDEEKKN